MDSTLQKRLFEEINGHYDASSTSLAESEVTHLASTYFDADYLAREQALVRTLPIIVGHASRLAKTGDFFAHDDTGVPLLVVRQSDGSLKAFLNICRHRGAHVCPVGTGSKKTFTCPYHAWTYRADGKLLAAPQPGFPNIAASDHGLVELPVEARHGLVWVVLTPGASIDVASHLGALDAELASYPLSEFVLERDEVRKEGINWKFVLDGFLEVYHIPVLHPKSIAPWIHGTHSSVMTYGRHSRLVAPRKSFDGIRHLPFEDAEFMKHVAVNYQIFPNTIAVWQGDHFEIWTSYAGRSPSECTVRVQSAVRKEMIGEQFQKRWDRNWKVLIETVTAEDWTISREVQDSLPLVANQHVLFGRNEPALQHFHRSLDEALPAPKEGP